MAEQPSTSATQPEILIVEDSPVETEILRRCLARANYKITLARDGEAGLQAARACRPALIVSDIQMPLMNGYELCHAIKYDEALWNIPVILLTMLSEAEDIMESINSGADGYITKPFVESILLERIRSLLSIPITRKRAEERRTEKVEYSDKRYTINGGSQQILNLLLSVYENSLSQNRDLIRIQGQLNLLNESLEDKIAERTHALQRLTRYYSALSQCNQAIMRLTSEEELFSRICQIVMQDGGMKMAWIGLLDDTGKQVKPITSCGDGAEHLENLQILLEIDSPFWHGPISTSIRGDNPVWNHDFLHDPLTANWHEIGARYRWFSGASLPLHRKGIVIGMLALYSGEINAFDEDARKLLTEMVEDIDHALNNFVEKTERKQAEEKLSAQLDELRRWQETTLGREMRTLELKHEVNELLGKAGQPPRYPSAEQE